MTSSRNFPSPSSSGGVVCDHHNHPDYIPPHPSLRLQLNNASFSGGAEFNPSKGGRTDLTEIPVKDVVIVIFMLVLWLYSIMLIVRAWAKVHNLPDSATNIGGNMWRFVIEYLYKRRKGGEVGGAEVKSSTAVPEKDEDADELSKDAAVALEVLENEESGKDNEMASSPVIEISYENENKGTSRQSSLRSSSLKLEDEATALLSNVENANKSNDQVQHWHNNLVENQNPSTFDDVRRWSNNSHDKTNNFDDFRPWTGNSIGNSSTDHRKSPELFEVINSKVVERLTSDQVVNFHLPVSNSNNSQGYKYETSM